MDLTVLGRVVLDSSCCIYYLDRPADDARRILLAPLVAAAEAGAVDVVVSTVTMLELLVKPLREADRTAEAAVRVFLDQICRVVSVGPEVADAAARLRARHGLPAPDALICATGVVEQADAVLGNDRRWQRVTELEYLHMDDLADRAPYPIEEP